MNAVVESSLVIGWFRRIARGSLVCGALLVVTRPLLRGAQLWIEVVERRVRLHAATARYTRATAVLEGSRLVTRLESVLAPLAAAWRSSAASRLAGPMLRWASVLEPWQRVRLLGWTLLVALLTCRVMGSFGNVPVNSVDLTLWGGGLALAVGLISGCRAIGSAWIHRAPGRHNPPAMSVADRRRFRHALH